MRIVLDTNSKGWKTFLSYALGIFILFVIMIGCKLVAKFSGWDMEFMTGWLSAAHVFTYKWREK